MIIATATQMKNNFGKYLKYALRNGEVYIEKHGTIVAKLILIEKSNSCLSEGLKQGIFGRSDLRHP